MTIQACNIWIDGTGWKPAIVKTGHKYSHAVIQDLPQARIKRIRNDQAITRPLLKDGQTYCMGEFCLKLLDFGERQGITQGAINIVNEAWEHVT